MAETCLPVGARVADIGAGTGISTRQLAQAGFEVLGVEPNEAMRAEADDEPVVGTRYVDGSAESMPMADGSMDAVLGFQCFHWFDLDRALPELRRVLKPGAHVYAIWNLRDSGSPAMVAYEDILLELVPEYAHVGAEPRAEALVQHPLVEGAETQVFAHAQSLDRTSLRGRCWSSSYVRLSVTDADALDRRLDSLFDDYAADGSFRFEYRTIAHRLALRG